MIDTGATYILKCLTNHWYDEFSVLKVVALHLKDAHNCFGAG
jgi:hypothetical protein